MSDNEKITVERGAYLAPEGSVYTQTLRRGGSDEQVPAPDADAADGGWRAAS